MQNASNPVILLIYILKNKLFPNKKYIQPAKRYYSTSVVRYFAITYYLCLQCNNQKNQTTPQQGFHSISFKE